MPQKDACFSQHWWYRDSAPDLGRPASKRGCTADCTYVLFKLRTSRGEIGSAYCVDEGTRPSLGSNVYGSKQFVAETS
jgi:hypothetical protein